MIDYQTLKTAADTANTANYVRSVFVSLGVDPANIKAVHHSPGGFAPRPNRWCVVLHKAVRLSAVRVNAQPGLSGAVWNGSVCHVLVGRE